MDKTGDDTKAIACDLPPAPERPADENAPNPSTEPTRLIVGPSHTVRWSWHVRDGVVRCELSHDRIIGLGGAPIWSQNLLQRTKALADPNGKIAILVPDFRFGNGICLTPDALHGPLMRDGFLGIDAKAITEANDRIMLEHGLAGLRLWQQHLGKRVRYLFWCLFGRQVHDRMAGRHIGNGRYHHPVFNYSEIVAC